MHLGTAALLEFHARHRDDEALVLVTITGTRGSTYRKPGAMMLIAPDDDYVGLISGGCLEGDLLQHARGVFASGEAKRVVYDMHSDEDLVWGLGIGCDGIIELLVQKLDGDAHRAVFDHISTTLDARRRALFAVVAESDSSEVQLARLAVLAEGGEAHGNKALAALAGEVTQAAWPDWRFSESQLGEARVALVNLLPQPRLLLCGGGPDARPVAEQARLLGWRCLVADHRSAYAREDRFPPGTEIVLGRPQVLSKTIDLSAFDAAVIMSHHLESDAAYLGQLGPMANEGALRYLGVLGPVARRERLREMAQCPEVLVHGPVGLDIGAELPEAIALSMVAEIHAVLNQRDGQSLTTGPVGRGN